MAEFDAAMRRDRHTDDVESGDVGKAETADERGIALQEIESVQAGGENADDDLTRTGLRVVDVLERAHLGTAVGTLHICPHRERTCLSTAIPRRSITLRIS